MVLYFLLLSLCLGALVKCDSGGQWCYAGCYDTPSYWKEMHGTSCGGQRQSPIDINTHHVERDSSLVNLTFVNFSSEHAPKSLINNGHTIKCKLQENMVEVSGGGLSATYSTIQFHFHWGKGTAHDHGSEHEIDGSKYPMEMHIVSLKKGLNVSEAVADPEGIAVLGFFITSTEDSATSEAWETLTSYLNNVTRSGNEVNITHSFSIDDLIGNVDRSKFYRYNGSLTTPNCNEAVIWTIFQEPIKISNALIKKFPEKTHLENVFRPPQNLNQRRVLASPAIPIWCYGHCSMSSDLNTSHWHLLPHSHCGGERQSPVNILSKSAEKDDKLKNFNYTQFDDKHAIKYIINTGHTVKCVLKEDTVEISGGGLEHVYSTLQFHFHWGDMSNHSVGSEHTVDSKRYPMEMHIVSKRKDLSIEDAITKPNGLAVLGFFIEAKTEAKSSSEHQQTTHQTGTTSSNTSSSTSGWHPWKNLTSYLQQIEKIGSKVEVAEGLSINDLLGDVDRTTYYRYKGSLTTPTCNEAVVWTVFKYPIKIDISLMKMFPMYTGYHNVYRPTQSLHQRKVYISAASVPCESVTLLLLLACLYGLTV